MAGIEKLVATKQAEEGALYCFLAGTLRREPEFAPLGYDRIQLFLQVRTENDVRAKTGASLLADITLNQGDREDDHARIIDLVTDLPGRGCSTFALETLCLIADWHGCRGIMGELFAEDVERAGERLFGFFRKQGFDVMAQEGNRIHPYRVQTTSYRDRLPEGIALSLENVIV